MHHTNNNNNNNNNNNKPSTPPSRINLHPSCLYVCVCVCVCMCVCMFFSVLFTPPTKTGKSINNNNYNNPISLLVVSVTNILSTHVAITTTALNYSTFHGQVRKEAISKRNITSQSSTTSRELIYNNNEKKEGCRQLVNS